MVGVAAGYRGLRGVQNPWTRPNGLQHDTKPNGPKDGGAGLRAAIAAAQANPNAKIALISKVYPMRSHTVAAEGGSAAGSDLRH